MSDEYEKLARDHVRPTPRTAKDAFGTGYYPKQKDPNDIPPWVAIVMIFIVVLVIWIGGNGK